MTVHGSEEGPGDNALSGFPLPVFCRLFLPRGARSQLSHLQRQLVAQNEPPDVDPRERIRRRRSRSNVELHGELHQPVPCSADESVCGQLEAQPKVANDGG